jgi:hypothetical protein
MGKGIVVIILYKCLSAFLRIESKLIVAACRDASVIRGISEFVHCRTLASQHAATISSDSSFKRAEKHLYKMMTTIPLPICNLFHLCFGPDDISLAILSTVLISVFFVVNTVTCSSRVGKTDSLCLMAPKPTLRYNQELIFSFNSTMGRLHTKIGRWHTENK